MFNPFARQMFNSKNLHLNQYHHESLAAHFEMGWVKFESLLPLSNCCNVMKSPHSYILKTHATIISSFSWVNTPNGPIFLLLVFPYRWLKSEITSMPQNLLAPHKEVILFSTTSMVASNNSFDHLPLGFVVGILFVLADLCIVFDIVWKRTFSLSVSCQFNTPLHLL